MKEESSNPEESKDLASEEKEKIHEIATIIAGVLTHGDQLDPSESEAGGGGMFMYTAPEYYWNSND